MKKRMIASVSAALVYLLLLHVLAASERAAGGGIQTMGDALWYSLVTMTTVGYGDLFPVTPVGKMIGAVFLLMSLGILTFLLSTALTLLTGKSLPGLHLFFSRKRCWYVFSNCNEASLTLAKQLLDSHPKAEAVFCLDRIHHHARSISVPFDLETLCRLRYFSKGPRHIFLISEDEARNREQAFALHGLAANLYCRSEESDALTDVVFFNPREICARLYWRKTPPAPHERNIILLGNGTYAQAMLDQAILVNCMSPWRTLSYHLFGDWSAYLNKHHRLNQAFSIGCEQAGKDALFFHADFPEAALLEYADRIILCEDDSSRNAELARTLSRWFVCSGRVDALTTDQTAPCQRFGESSELYTEALVMKQAQDQAARAMHETYRQSVETEVPAWEALNLFTKNSNRAVADHLPVKRMLLAERHASWAERDDGLTEQCRRNEHERWLRFYSLYNWRYGPQRDAAQRTHPCMVPYEQLHARDQAKDDFAWEQMTQFEHEEESL